MVGNRLCLLKHIHTYTYTHTLSLSLSFFIFLSRSAMKTKTYDLDGAVPGARGKGVLGDGAPGDGEGLALVLVEVHDGELGGDADIVHLDRPVAARDQQLVLVDLGPGEVVLRIVGIEPVF